MGFLNGDDRTGTTRDDRGCRPQVTTDLVVPWGRQDFLRGLQNPPTHWLSSAICEFLSLELWAAADSCQREVPPIPTRAFLGRTLRCMTRGWQLMFKQYTCRPPPVVPIRKTLSSLVRINSKVKISLSGQYTSDLPGLWPFCGDS